jgi:Glycosyltransferase family 87
MEGSLRRGLGRPAKLVAFSPPLAHGPAWPPPDRGHFFGVTQNLNPRRRNADQTGVRARLETVVLALFGLGASAAIAFRPGDVQDYRVDAGPSLSQLIHGHPVAAFSHEPAMGWFAIFFRAPFAWLARHGSELAQYRSGAFACVLAGAALGLYLALRARREGRSLVLAATVVALASFSPMSWHALADGHPEEILGAVLGVSAVLLSADGRRPLVTGIVLGLALATKQWAILALGPVLLAAPRKRPTIAAIGIAVAAAFALIPVLAGSHSLFAPANIAGATQSIKPASIWWPLGETQHLHLVAGWTVERHVMPQWLANLTHPLIVLTGLVLPLAYAVAKRRTRAGLDDALTLLTLLFLLRCLLDPMTVGYYHVPMLFSLLALEATSKRGLPLLTLLANGVLWLLVARIPWGLEPGRVATIYLAWALPMTAYLALRLYAPSVISSLGKWLRISAPSSVTTTRSSIRTPNAPGM